MAECCGKYFFGDLQFDPVSDHTRVHHPECETGPQFAKQAAAYLLRLRRQERDASS